MRTQNLSKIPIPHVELPHSNATPKLRKSRRKRPPWLGASFGFLAGVAFAVALGFFFLDRPLNLDAKTMGSHLFISWNRSAGILTGATGAELDIAGYPRELTTSELRTGRLEMPIPAGDFEIRMRVRGPYAESQRAVLLMVSP